MRFDSADAIKAMVQHGLGLSILPIWTVNDVLRRGSIHLVERREPPLFTDVVLVRREASYVPKAVRVFISSIWPGRPGSAGCACIGSTRLRQGSEPRA